MLKKVLKAAAIFLFALILIPVIFITYTMATDYRPQAVTPLEPTFSRSDKVSIDPGKPISIVSFNIGYCGLDKDQDFFSDGGTKSRSESRSKTLENLDSIASFLSGRDADAVLLQEVDLDSSRSYHINEYDYLKTSLRGYNSTFGVNYKVPWVPLPLTHPMGAAYSGLATFTTFNINSTARYQYPGSESWPTQLFELDRCFVENRLPVKGGKELLLINSHLSAFDKGGVIRKQQLDFLKAYITGEYAKGNYIIAGGDWNHSLPGTDPYRFASSEGWPFWLQTLPGDFTPDGFKWAVDKEIPSNRTVAKAYTKGENFTSVIDGFLVSPNIDIQSVTGHDLGFENSDHNPVTGRFILNK